jgi:hypothetical protein
MKSAAPERSQSDFYSRENARRASYAFSTGSMTDYSLPYTYYGSDIRQGAFGNRSLPDCVI